MIPVGDEDALLDIVLRASLRQRHELSTVLLATYRIELTQALRSMAHRPADPADFDRVFALAVQIAGAAAAAKLPALRTDALALERSAAAAHLGSARGESELVAAGLKVIEQILATAPARNAPPEVRVSN